MTCELATGWPFLRDAAPARTTITGVAVPAFGPGGESEPLRHLRIDYNHYINYAVLSAGTWTFHLVAKVDGRTASMTIRRTVG